MFFLYPACGAKSSRAFEERFIDECKYFLTIGLLIAKTALK